MVAAFFLNMRDTTASLSWGIIHQRRKSDHAEGKGHTCMSGSLARQQRTGSNAHAVTRLCGYNAAWLQLVDRLADLVGRKMMKLIPKCLFLPEISQVIS